MEYVLITPVHNEERYILKTLESVVQQSRLPKKWLIINDRSTDETPGIIKNFIARFPWIAMIESPEFSTADLGARIANMVNFGVQHITVRYDVIVKLDADVFFEKTFFENILQSFTENAKLGIASGHLTEMGIPEKVRYYDHTRGAAKAIRFECWKDINGLVLSTGWDTLCDISAQMNGWETKTLDVYFEHQKEEGLKKGTFKKFYLNGLYFGRVRYTYLYFVAGLFTRLLKFPPLLGVMMQIAGYVKGRYFEEPLISDDLSNYYRKIQRKRLRNIFKL